MSEDEYYAALHALGLKRIPDAETELIELWRLPSGLNYGVTKASELTPDERREALDWHRAALEEKVFGPH